MASELERAKSAWGGDHLVTCLMNKCRIFNFIFQNFYFLFPRKKNPFKKENVRVGKAKKTGNAPDYKNCQFSDVAFVGLLS